MPTATCVVITFVCSILVLAAEEEGAALEQLRKTQQDISALEPRYTSRLKELRRQNKSDYIIRKESEAHEILQTLAMLSIKRSETIEELCNWLEYKEEFYYTTEKTTIFTRSSVARALNAAGPSAAFVLLNQCKEDFLEVKAKTAIAILDNLIGTERSKIILKDFVILEADTDNLALIVKGYLERGKLFLLTDDNDF